MHQAADGGLARVRVPGGVLSRAQLDVLRRAATDLGDGNLELTSRANIQLRGLVAGAERDLSERLYRAGLLPSLTHERVRNILASPLTGLVGRPDVLPLIAELDQRLQATPELAELPGRFLFAVDDGTGDLLDQQADVTVQLRPDGDGLLVLAGDTSQVAQVDDIPTAMLAAAQAFLTEREHACPTERGYVGDPVPDSSAVWRVTDLPNGAARILARLGRTAVPRPLTHGSRPKAGSPLAAHAAGVQADPLVTVVPLGTLGPEQVEVLLEAEEVRVTPWRSVVVPGGVEPGRLEAVGLVVDPASPWNDVTACAGRPGCAKALADVRADARRIVPRLPPYQRPLHWSGCERRCGRPAGEYVDVLATRDGYVIDGERKRTR